MEHQFLIIVFISVNNNQNNNHKPDIVDYLVDDILRPIGRGLFKVLSFKGKSKVKDNRIIIGKDENNQEHHIYPEERREHSLISGTNGSGKSLEAIKNTVQLINLGYRVCYIDPAGTGTEATYKAIKNTDNILYLSLNKDLQKDKILGFNPFYFIDQDTYNLNQYASDLYRMIFDNSSMEIKIQGKFIVESVIYFHNCYLFYLSNNGVELDKIQLNAKQKQITFNDISLIMNNNQNIFDLFYDVLSTNCEFKRIDLATRWHNVKNDKKTLNYLIQASKRFEDYTDNSASSNFLESTGFNPLEALKENKTVLIDLKGIDPSVCGLISSLIFSKLAGMHKNKELKGQTDLFIDEAKGITIPNLEEMITECRKDKLAITLIFQYLTQFDNQPKTKQAIQNCIAHTYEFVNNHPAIKSEDTKDLKQLAKFNFLYTYNGEIKVRKILKVDFPKQLREFTYEPKGELKTVIKARKQAKLNNIYNYFTTYEN